MPLNKAERERLHDLGFVIEQDAPDLCLEFQEGRNRNDLLRGLQELERLFLGHDGWKVLSLALDGTMTVFREPAHLTYWAMGFLSAWTMCDDPTGEG